jgi:hypothetical protein
MRAFLLAMTAALLCGAAMGQDGRWKQVVPGVRWDTQSLVEEKDVRVIWWEGKAVDTVRQAMEPMLGAKAKEIETGRFREAFHCAGRHSVVLDLMYLDKHGKTLASHEVPANETSWELVMPGTLTELLLEEVCHR